MICANENALKSLKKRSKTVLDAESGYEGKRLTLCGVEFAYIYFAGIVAAFIGWVAENAVKLISSGVIDNRFHVLPFISPYALVPVALQVLLGDPDDLTVFGKKVFKKKTKTSIVLSNAISLITICLTVFAGEFIVGNLWEKLFGAKLWNYSSQPLHFTQYVSVFSAAGYGAGAYLLFKFALKPFIVAVKNKISYDHIVDVCTTLGVIIVLDTLIMCIITVVFGKAPIYWSLVF